MFKNRILFVVGAGASAELNMPTGPALLRKVSDLSDVRVDHFGTPTANRATIELLRREAETEGCDFKDVFGAVRLIAEGAAYAPSIDNFIDMHRGNADVAFVGKILIAQCILEAERASWLYNDHVSAPWLNEMQVSKSWLPRFFSAAATNVSRDEVDFIFEKVSFVVFNYDRCIEHFLVRALMRAYGIDLTQSAQIGSDLTLIHPYGQVGKPKLGDTGGVQYGAERTSLGRVVKSLSTFTEQEHDAQMLQDLQNQVMRADTIVFIGFAYYEQNMQLMTIPAQQSAVHRVLGTAYATSPDDREVFELEIRKMLGVDRHHPPVRLFETTAAQFFDNVGRRLAAGI